MGAIFWLVLTFIFVFLEVFIPALITIWFAIASALTIFVSFVFIDVNIEIIFFVLVSIFLLVFTRPFAKKYLSKNKENFDSSMAGTKVEVCKVIDVNKEEKNYEVKFKGAIWSAVSFDIFVENELAVIHKFKGNKIIIKK